MKYLLSIIPLFLFGCESGTDNTTDIPEHSCSSSTTDETNFRDGKSVICRTDSSDKSGCKATCIIDDEFTSSCTCVFPDDDSKGSCKCCLDSGECASSEYDPSICQ